MYIGYNPLQIYRDHSLNDKLERVMVHYDQYQREETKKLYFITLHTFIDAGVIMEFHCNYP